MLPAIRISNRAKRAVLPALASAAGAAMASCITSPPADVPTIPVQGPTIVQDAVRPPVNESLTALPPGGAFLVPVRVSDPNKAITCRVFVDFDAGADDGTFATGAVASCPDTLPALGDGGLTLLSFTLTATSFADPTTCHAIQCLVADDFDASSANASGEGLAIDSVTWQYAPNGPGGCSPLGGGDAAYRPDASTESLPPTPDAAGS